MLGGTACFYALYILTGWETMDLVGLVTTTVEAAAALIVLSPAAAATGRPLASTPSPSRRSRSHWSRSSAPT